MILRRLSEAKMGTDLSKAWVEVLKGLGGRFVGLRDTTLIQIINIFLKEMKKEGKRESELKPEDVVAWFDEAKDYADFVFLYPTELSSWSVADFADHDDKLREAIKQVLVDAGILDNEGNDLTLGGSKKMNTYEMCTTLFDVMPRKAVAKRDRKIPQWVYKIHGGLEAKGKDPETERLRAEAQAEYDALTPEQIDEYNEFVPLIIEYERTTKDPGLERDSFSAVERKYHDLFESVKKHLRLRKVNEAAEEEETEEEVEIEIPEEEPVEPLEEPKPEEPVADPVNPDVSERACYDTVNALIKLVWDIISQIGSTISTLEYEYKGDNKEDVIKILNGVMDDSTINIGMLHKALDLISLRTQELLNSGETKAEEIID